MNTLDYEVIYSIGYYKFSIATYILMAATLSIFGVLIAMRMNGVKIKEANKLIIIAACFAIVSMLTIRIYYKDGAILKFEVKR